MFKENEEVRVRRNLKVGEVYDTYNFTEGMKKHKGNIVTISKVVANNLYHIKEDDNRYAWTNSMLSKVRKKKENTSKDVELVEVIDEKSSYFGMRAIKRYDYLEFFQQVGGHSGNGSGEDGYCWWLNKESYKKAELEKIKVYDSTKIIDTNLKENVFVNLKPLFNLCHDTWLHKMIELREEIINNNVCEIVYKIVQENEDIFILRKKDYYFAIYESGIKEPAPENNSDITKDLIKSIDSLSKKIEERSPFQEAMTQAIIEKGKELATEDLKKELKIELNDFIEKTYGVLPKKFTIQHENKIKDLTGLFHKDFERICKIVDSNVPLMLVGGAGAGKNHTLEQVSEALGLTFYTTNAVNQDYKLTGFIDANGKYHETEFYKAFTNGGMFFLDEIDASCPEALIILNGAIANKYFDFPIGRVHAHKDFRVVCAGNTYGTGADMVYVGRNVLDGATLDRFVVLNFDYDEDVEKALAYDNSLYTFIRDLREAVNNSGLRYIVSMRALINSTKLLEIGIDKETILKTSIIKNMQKDDINTIVKKIKHTNDWVSELKKLSDIND